MRLPWVLLAGAILGAAQGDLLARNDGSDLGLDPRQNEPNATPGISSTSADASSTSDSGSSTSNGGSGDTTIFQTKTVTGDVKTVSKKTTVLTTITTTVVITSTKFSTTTVTSRDEATATKTIYVTSTKMANSKRALDISPRTVGPAEAAAAVTAHVPVSTANANSFELVKERDEKLAKRDTITDVKTVTAGDGGSTTVFDTIRNTVVSTKTKDTTTVHVVTETDQADAKTTITVTSTLVVTSTSVTTGAQTQTGADTGATGGADSSGSSSSSSGGLSTGAKAGIGAGVGVAALAALAGLAWFCLRRRRSGPKLNPDDMYGASEVPIGGPVGGRTPPMSQHSAAAAAFLAPGRTPPKQSVSPVEGYRGTAAGDGRAGYAKPAPFGSAYSQPTNRSSTLVSNTTSNGADHLPEHAMPAEMGGAETAASTRQQQQMSPHAAELGSGPGGAAKWHVTNAAEMDSPISPANATAPANAQFHHPAGQDVYEMPAQ